MGPSRDDHGGLGAPAAHLTAEVGAEHHVVAVGDRGVGEHLRAQLDALTTDAGEDDVASAVELHRSSLRWSIAPVKGTPDSRLSLPFRSWSRIRTR